MRELAGARRIPVKRAEYYPFESELADDEIGIRDMGVYYLEVGWGLDETQPVTLAARSEIDGDAHSYEIDLTPGRARQLAALLEGAARAADDAVRRGPSVPRTAASVKAQRRRGRPPIH